MVEDIKTSEEIWNSRFKGMMEEKFSSQRAFAEAYKARFGKGSQSNVNKWLHVGEKDGKTKKPRQFPEFETMKNIAEILEVSVGFLIGETDYKTYEMQHACEYTGLTPTAVESIKKITSGRAIPPFYKYPNKQVNSALSNLLSCSCLVDYLHELCELAEAMNQERNPRNNFDKVCKTLPEDKRNQIIAFWNDPEDAAEQGLVFTDEIGVYSKLLDEAAVNDLCQPDIIVREIKSAKYALQECHIKMIDEIESGEKMISMLPNYEMDNV